MLIVESGVIDWMLYKVNFCKFGCEVLFLRFKE